jgi:hypothetical protein
MRALPTTRWRRPCGVLLRPLAVAVLVAVVVEVGIRLFLPSLPEPRTWPSPESQHKVDQLKQWRAQHTEPAVVVAGASMADVGIDAGALAAATGSGRGGYNAALTGAVLPSLAVWTSRVIVPELRPRVVVLGLSPVELNPNLPNLAAGYDEFASADPVQRVIGDETWLNRLNRWAGDVSDLFRYRTVLRTPSDWGSGPERNGKAGQDLDPALTSDGQSQFFANRTMQDFGALFTSARARHDSIARGVFYRFTVGPRQVDQIRAFVRALQVQGARVLLVDLPVDPEAVGDLPGGAVSVHAASVALAQIATSTHAAFFDAGVWDPALFGDPVHLNVTGSARLTTLLAPAVRATFDAPREIG